MLSSTSVWQGTSLLIQCQLISLCPSFHVYAGANVLFKCSYIPDMQIGLEIAEENAFWEGLTFGII
jgi:hypothetical protein